MAEGLIISAGAHAGSAIFDRGLGMLGKWAGRKWWPTGKLCRALPLSAIGFTQNETSPCIRFNRGDCSLRFALKQTNNSPYHVDWLAAVIEVSVEDCTVAKFEIGARGQVKARDTLEFRVEHAMTEHEMFRLRTAVDHAKKERRESSPTTKLRISRLYRTKYGDHRDCDDAPITLEIQSHVVGDEPAYPIPPEAFKRG